MKQVELLLLESIDNLGLVGDVVKVKPGFARNYLLPRGFAEPPTEEKVAALADVRAKAAAEQERIRSEQEALIEKIAGYELTLERAANDQGVLFGGVSQHEIAESLREAGFAVEDRHIRIGNQVKRIDQYHIPVWLNKDLKTEITLNIVSDRPLDLDEEVEEAEEQGEHGETQAEAPADAPAEEKTEAAEA
ncbi:50S ribosomal protein L9 [Mucisphaera calidilacus]|uniref:Large ribosomal subunit protein bL9 n=1 Tax=Mucisphaera calidilacus TaxID=2527982 RepID=A0A518BYU2_9BACT|nr:50S ribosomal protein L9 [Mucisphaera calidilacus]QDU72138.1 50S ribosomal protein L9 [Mucisphaera calidilacus]